MMSATTQQPPVGVPNTGDTAMVDVAIADTVEDTDAIEFECSREDLLNGRVSAPAGLNVAEVIADPTRYTSIVCERVDGTRIYDVWQSPTHAIIHGVPIGDGTTATGTIVAREGLTFFVGQLVVSLVGQLSDARRAYDFEAAAQEDANNANDSLLMIASGAPDGLGPRAAIVNSDQGTYAGIAAPEVETIDVSPVSPVKAWAIIVGALHGHPDDPRLPLHGH